MKADGGDRGLLWSLLLCIIAQVRLSHDTPSTSSMFSENLTSLLTDCCAGCVGGGGGISLLKVTRREAGICHQTSQTESQKQHCVGLLAISKKPFRFL